MVDCLKKDIAHLNNLKEFKEYKHSNINSYLCAAFMIIEPNNKSDWQIDYYNPDNDRITTFGIYPNIEKKESSTIHKGDSKICELNMENIDIGLDNSLNIASSVMAKNYPSEKATKIIIILQNINKKETWNVTYLTSSFKIFNLNIDAQDGSILKEKFENILNFNTQ